MKNNEPHKHRIQEFMSIKKIKKLPSSLPHFLTSVSANETPARAQQPRVAAPSRKNGPSAD